MKSLQREEEMAWFVGILQSEGVRSLLEVGSKFGGSLRRFAMALPKGSRVVSVDLPTAESGSEKLLRKTVDELKAAGYDTHLILGNSTRGHIIEQVRALGPFDACFIDANHTLPYVTKDWNNYGPMSRIVAFHDINFKQNPDVRYKGIEVPQFWESIKGGYRHDEIRIEKRHNGIGVLWRS